MIERRPGRWRLQVTAPPDADGNRLRLSRTIDGTRADAREALQRFVVETGAGLYGGATTTVGSLLDQFLATSTAAPTTRADWESVARQHLKPSLGDLELWKLTARHCDQLYARMNAGGLGPSRVRCAHVVLHRAVAQAVRWGWLARNPVSAATRPAVPRVLISPPTIEQVRALLAAAADVDAALACWLQVAVATGARRGEICGLRWSDVDLDDASVRIQRSVSATRQAGLTIKSTKTGGVRVVSLTTQAVIALRGHHRSTHHVAADAYVFSNDADGARPWRPDLVTRRWERLRRTGRLDRRVRIHDLRHFVATELLSAGIDVRTVANRLGHARTSTTLDIYWAWVPARDRDASAHLALLLAANK